VSVTPTVTPIVKKVNPWLSGSGVYDLLEPEVKKVTDSFKNRAPVVGEQCKLLKGWGDKKKSLLMDGYVYPNDHYKV